MTSKSLLYTAGLMACLFITGCSQTHIHEHDGAEHSHDLDHAKAHYMANSAVLITQGETKVLFDPLFHNNYGQYQLVPDDVRARVLAGTEEFEGVDAVFISHAHGDHFDAADANNYMASQPDVRFIAPQQAIDNMKKDEAWNDDFMARITAVNLDYGAAPLHITVGEITASAVRIPHAGWPDPRRVSVQNMVYRVNLGPSDESGATVMHMGDADPRAQHYTPFEDHWQAQQTDTAFPPYWFFLREGGEDILTNMLNVKDAVGVHVPSTVPENLKTSGADYFSIPGEIRDIE